MFERITSDNDIDFGGLDSASVNFISRLLDKSPENWLGSSQNGIQEIIEHEWFKEIEFNEILAKTMKAPYIPDPDIDHVEPEFI